MFDIIVAIWSLVRIGPLVVHVKLLVATAYFCVGGSGLGAGGSEVGGSIAGGSKVGAAGGAVGILFSSSPSSHPETILWNCSRMVWCLSDDAGH